MKYICFILVLLITALSVIPCSDKPFSVEEKLSVTSKTEKADQHQAEHEDLCSPFCQCSCCNTSTLVSAPISLAVLLNLVQHKHSGILPEKVLNSAASIWQPPQLLS
ncbi:DUF6660 family protein [Arcticibacter sp. MXS-1]|uniref:DUF6660 family protein n=1 Tax=Arcticibacter sp. MXS-1 TaxID=3341726 RepID=UPI0035A88672